MRSCTLAKMAFSGPTPCSTHSRPLCPMTEPPSFTDSYTQAGGQPSSSTRSSRDRRLWQVDATLTIQDGHPGPTRKPDHTIRPQALHSLHCLAKHRSRRRTRRSIAEATPPLQRPTSPPRRLQPSHRRHLAHHSPTSCRQHSQRPHRDHPPRLQKHRPAVRRHSPVRADRRPHMRGLPARPALRDSPVQVRAS